MWSVGILRYMYDDFRFPDRAPFILTWLLAMPYVVFVYIHTHGYILRVFALDAHPSIALGFVFIGSSRR
jgi:hypothetical protein